MYKEFSVESKWFDKIKNKTKTIEIRLNTPRRRHLKANDLIKIKNEANGELLIGKVQKVHSFSTFAELFKTLDNNKLGFENGNSNSYQKMYDYYTQKDELNNGVIGVEFELITVSLDDIDNFVFDMDGTLLNENARPVLENLETIKELQKEGKKIAICTGRPFFTLESVLTEFEPDYPIVAANGAMIYDNKTKDMISFLSIDKKESRLIYNFLVENNFEFVVYTDRKMYGHYTGATDFFPKRKFYNSLKPEKYEDITEKFNIDDHGVSKYLILTESVDQNIIPKMEELANRFPNMHGVYSRHDMYDIMNSEASKGTGLVYLSKHNGLDLSRTIVFGDSENDISMFIQAKYSGAMANGFDEVRKHSLFECDNNTTPWFKKFINSLKAK